MFLRPPAEDTAVRRLHHSDLTQLGYVMNLSRAWAWRPEVCEGFAALRTLLTGSSALAPRELAVIVCAAAATRADAYCARAWGQRLAAMCDAGTAAAVLSDTESETLTPRERALASWTRQITADPNATTPGTIDELRAAGLSDKEIFEATVFAAFRIAFSTVNAALGVNPDWQLADAAAAEVGAAVDFGRPCARHDGEP